MYSVSADGSRKRGVDSVRTLCNVFCVIKACVPEASRAVERAMWEIFMIIVIVDTMMLNMEIGWFRVVSGGKSKERSFHLLRGWSR